MRTAMPRSIRLKKKVDEETGLFALRSLWGATASAAGQNTAAVLLGGQVRAWGVLNNATFTTPQTLPAVGGTVTRIHVADSVVGLIYAVSSGAVLRYTGTSWTGDYVGFANVDRIATDGKSRLGTSAARLLSASGDNDVGLLAQGNTNSVAGVVTVAGFADTALVQIANNAAIAARGDGTLWFWGHDFAGQSGDGSLIGSSVPSSVTIAGNVQSVAAGEHLSLALESLGRQWGWGLNGQSQLVPGPSVPIRVHPQGPPKVLMEMD